MINIYVREEKIEYLYFIAVYKNLSPQFFWIFQTYMYIVDSANKAMGYKTFFMSTEGNRDASADKC